MNFGRRHFLMNQTGGGDGGGAGGNGAGGSAGGAGGAGTGGNPNPGTGGTPSDWTSTLNDDTRSYVQTKGFKDPAAVVDSYRNFEKLMGAPKERLLTLPDKEDAPEWAAIHDRLGRPAKAEDYKIEVGPEVLSPEATTFLKNEFHKLGITQKQGETLMKNYGEYFKGEVGKTEVQNQATLQQQQNDLKKSWGAAFDQNMQTAKNAAIAFKFDAGKIDALEAALGYDGVMNLLHDLGTKVGPHQFHGGSGNGSSGGMLTPTQAQAEIKALRADPAFAGKFLAGEIDAKEKMSRLHKMAYPDN